MQILARPLAPMRRGKPNTPSHSDTQAPRQAGAVPGRASDTSTAPAQEGAQTPAGEALGIYAKTDSAFSKPGPQIRWVPTDDDTGEVVAFELRGTEWVPHKSQAQIRIERYRLKGVVNGFLPGSRVHKCHRWRVPTKTVQVMNSVEFNRAFYAGLQVCASVWLCPICAPKISERRRVELKSGIDAWSHQGGRVLLLTLTVPHGLGDDLTAMLDQMLDAWRRTTTSRAGIAGRKQIGLKGTIRVLEVTHGRNGWHPHFHVLLFVNARHTLDQVHEIMSPLWQTACVKSGLPRPSDEHGVRVDGGERAASYASKWGLEHEMTKGHLKRSKGPKGLTPWDMLRDYQETKSQRSRLLWMAYAGAFKGRRQLYWSNGLRKLLDVVDLDDAEIAAQKDDAAALLADLTDEQWRDVLLTRSEAALLEVAECQPGAIGAYLDGVTALARAMGGVRPIITDPKPQAVRA